MKSTSTKNEKNTTAYTLKPHIVFLPVIFLSCFFGRSTVQYLSQWNIQTNIFWPRDLDLWPVTHYEIYLDVLPPDLHAKIQFRLFAQERHRCTHRHTMSKKTIALSANAGWKETWIWHISPVVQTCSCSFLYIHCTLGWPKIRPWPWVTLLMKPIDLPGVKIVQKNVREKPASVDPPYRPEGGGVKIFRKF